MTTHADLVGAAEKARPSPALVRRNPRWASARAQHVDDLLAILRIHTPYLVGDEQRQCRACIGPEVGAGINLMPQWPCPTVQIVADRLTSWNVLDV